MGAKMADCRTQAQMCYPYLIALSGKAMHFQTEQSPVMEHGFITVSQNQNAIVWSGTTCNPPTKKKLKIEPFAFS